MCINCGLQKTCMVCFLHVIGNYYNSVLGELIGKEKHACMNLG